MATPLIDREIFFGNPSIMGAQIAPDGSQISFIKPYEGMLNIWIKSKNAPFESAIPITNDRTRPITSYFWSRDSKYILYVQDKGGDENYHIYAVDPSKASDGKIPEALNLTNVNGVKAMIYKLPKLDHDKIYVGMNDRDAAWHDLYRLHMSTGDRELVLENTMRASAYYFNLQDELIAISRSTSDAGTEILIKRDGNWEPIYSCKGDEYCHIVKSNPDGNLYIESNVGDPDLSYLALLNPRTKDVTIIESDPDQEVDFGTAIFSELTDSLIATSYVGDKPRVYWKNEAFEKDHQFLKAELNNAQISWVSGTTDESEWIIGARSDVDPGATYYFNRDSRQLEFQYRPRPEVPLEHLCEMQAVRYPSLDGLNIPAYLTIPKDDVDIKAAIVMPHGGPWVRDTWGYHSYAQFLANRGYAVLQPNYRGSTGYGKSFLNGGEMQWGRKMQDDLTAGAQYLIRESIATADKIGILGGSYGGYATLAGLTFTPELYTCGVSIVGPSNLFTLLDSIPAYWESARAMFHRRMGNPETEEGRAHMTAISPFFHADKIQVPLLVAQGDNDPRVKTAESDQIVSAMVKHGLAVEYVNFPDEGHGFANPVNSMSFIAVMERFVAKHLGGRYQEEIPEHLRQIIDKVTVDVQKFA